MGRNIEILKGGAIEAFNNRDLDALAVITDEEFEFTSVVAAVDAEQATFTGTGAWRQYFEQMDTVWAVWRVDAIELREAEDGRIAAIVLMQGEGRSSGLPVSRKMGMAYDFRNGKILRMRAYLDPADALADVGVGR